MMYTDDHLHYFEVIENSKHKCWTQLRWRGRHSKIELKNLISGEGLPKVSNHTWNLPVTDVSIVNPNYVEWDLNLINLRFPNIKSLSIDKACRNIEVLKLHKCLVEININGPLAKDEKLNLNQFANLLSLEIFSEPENKFNFSCITEFSSKSLKNLSLFRSSFIYNDLSVFAEFPALQSLSLSFERVDNLSGIEKLKYLKKLELSYLLNLKNLEGLNWLANNLKQLKIENCSKVKNHQSISNLKSLEYFELRNAKNISSVSIFQKMEKLLSINLDGTVIDDGKLSKLLLFKSLEYVYYNNKKFYDIAEKQLNSELQNKKFS